MKQIPVLLQTFTQLQKQVKALQDQLVKHSHNSSYHHPRTAFCALKKRKIRARKVTKRQEVNWVMKVRRWKCRRPPNQVIVLAFVTHCQHCHVDLSTTEVQTVEQRQVIDSVQPRTKTMEYQAQWKCWPHCQGYTSAAFLALVRAPAQYGPRIAAIAMYLQV